MRANLLLAATFLAALPACSSGGGGGPPASSTTVAALIPTASTLTARPEAVPAIGFAPARDLPFGGGVGVVLADMNGDGFADLVVVGSGFVVRLADGAGGFSTVAQVHDAGRSTLAIAVADFDQDGRPDLAGAGDGIQVYLNTTPRGASVTSFDRSDFASGSRGVKGLAVGDLGAGVPGVVVVATHVGLTGYEHTRSLVDPVGSPTTDAEDIPRLAGAPLVTRDLTGRGDLFLAYGADLCLIRNRVAGGSLVLPELQWRKGFALDLNGDTIEDLALVTDGAALWFTTNERVAITPWDALGGSGTYQDACPGDFNGDGRPDFAVSQGTSGVQVWANNSGTGAAASFDRTASWSAGGSFTAVAAGDVNGDGLDDLVVSVPTGLRLYVAR